MRVLMLVNPHSGRKRGLSSAQQAQEKLEAHGIKVQCTVSERAGHLKDIARHQVNESWDAIVAVGGDGTLFEIINGMMTGNAQLPIPLGIIPVGTGNSFSRDLKSVTLEERIAGIVQRNTRAVDLGLCEYDDGFFYFINILGFGFVADVAYQASFYKHWGDVSYVIGVLKCTATLASYGLECELDGEPLIRDNIFVEICNSSKTGGDMLMAPGAQIDDGKLDVVLLNRLSRRQLLSALPRIFKGTHVSMPQVETFQVKKATFRPTAAKSLTPDGELLGSTPITLSILPGKLCIFD